VTRTGTRADHPDLRIDDGSRRAPRPDDTRAATRAVLALAWRLLRRGTVITALTVAGLSAFVVVQYRTTMDSTSIASLTELGANPAVRTLFGAPTALDDAGGFTVWRTGTPVAVIVGVWALLAATRATRGEEDARRWALLLTGPLPLDRIVLCHLAVLAGAPVLVGAALFTALLAAGTGVYGTALYAAGVTLVGMTFACVGILAAQLAPGRRQAAGIAGGAVAAGLLLRMVADGVDALAWLTWCTPFGLLAHVQPFADQRPAPLAVLAAMAVAAGVAAVLVARRRDLEAGPWAVSGTARPQPRWMRSPGRFALHRVRGGLLGWAAGLAAYFGLVGALTESMTRFLADNPRYAELAAEAGISGLDDSRGYAAALFGLLALPIGAVAAGLVAQDAEDEAAGRLTTLLALPVSRARWAVTVAAVSAVACTALATAAGAAYWAGALAAGIDMSLASSLAGALNGLPVALVCIGAALLALGWAPRAVFVLGWLPAIGGFLLDVLGSTFGWPDRVHALSPFTYTADVPLDAVDRGGVAVLVAAATLLGAIGVIGYSRRDLRG
jgi:ABC-2 type transport system permease protein